MVKAFVRYKDSTTGGMWEYSTCIANSIEEVKEYYGVGTRKDLVDWELLKVEDSETNN